MEDLNKQVSAGKNEGKEDLDERKSEATSPETLSDIEETESESASTNLDNGPGPSPDGSLDGLIDESNEIKDTGPI